MTLILMHIYVLIKNILISFTQDSHLVFTDMFDSVLITFLENQSNSQGKTHKNKQFYLLSVFPANKVCNRNKVNNRNTRKDVKYVRS